MKKEIQARHAVEQAADTEAKRKRWFELLKQRKAVEGLTEEQVNEFLDAFLPTADLDSVTPKDVVRALETSLGLKRNALKSQKNVIKRLVYLWIDRENPGPSTPGA